MKRKRFKWAKNGKTSYVRNDGLSVSKTKADIPGVGTFTKKYLKLLFGDIGGALRKMNNIQ